MCTTRAHITWWQTIGSERTRRWRWSRWWRRWWLIVFWPTNRITVKLNPVQYAIFELYFYHTRFTGGRVFVFVTIPFGSADPAPPGRGTAAAATGVVWSTRRTSVRSHLSSHLYRIRASRPSLRDRWHRWHPTVHVASLGTVIRGRYNIMVRK